MAKTRTKANHRPRRRITEPDLANPGDHGLISESVVEPGVNPANRDLGVEDLSNLAQNQNPNPESGSNPDFEWSEDQLLEASLMKNLDFWYEQAISMLVGLRYGKEVVLKGILINGYCFGNDEVLTNILCNTLTYLTSGNLEEKGETIFDDLRQLEEYCLNDMVYVLQMCKPHLSRGGAMWCLHISGLHVKRASKIDVPDGFLSNVSDISLDREIEFRKRYYLAPSMRDILKWNLLSDKDSQMETRVCSNCLCERDSSSEQNEDAKNQEVANRRLDMFWEMSLDEVSKFVPEMVLDLVHQINDVAEQVKERREWAQQKAMQAARKLVYDLSDLKMLRKEREETRRLKKQGIPTSEDPTMKKLSEMEIALRKASGKLDHANGVVRCLETVNAKIRANMEAVKLSQSEKMTTFLEVSKREKKYMKKLVAWEKQKTKMQEEIAAKKKISVMKLRMVEMETSAKDAEAKWREELKEKELALAQLEEERRVKKETEDSNKRRLGLLRLKIEIDFQLHNDDFQRLEQELSHLKTSAELTQQLANPPADIPEREIIEWMFGEPDNLEQMVKLDEMDNLDDISEEEPGSNRECMICMRVEVSVVFLPCAHQVLCVDCNEEYEKKGREICPFCKVRIEQRIRFFGASSF